MTRPESIKAEAALAGGLIAAGVIVAAFVCGYSVGRFDLDDETVAVANVETLYWQDRAFKCEARPNEREP